MTRARGVRSSVCVLATALVAGGAPASFAGQGSAVPDVSIRPANAARFVEHAAAEQQGGLGVTFFVRIENTGDATGSFLVDGDHGGAVFDVRYLAGGTGEDRITERVVAGTYRIEDVPAGRTRTLRIRVTVDDGAPVDRTGSWRLEVNAVGSPGDADAVRATVRSVTPAFARAVGVTLRVPAASALGITFHESLFGSAAALRPIGHLLQNDHASFDPPRDTVGPGYIVMESRDRGTPATSSSDDVLERTEPVLAPVTGKVIRVTRYDLYCEWPDVRVAIRPADAPERTVQIFHVADPRVARGDRVVVSHTVIGRARLFPFRTQTQDYGLSGRHVHLEIERDGSTPLPGCGVTARPGRALLLEDL
jgi:hypothetical protein